MNKSLLILYSVAFFKSQVLLMPVLLLFYLSNGLSIGDYFLFQGIMTLLTLFLEIPVGYVSDRTSPKILLMFSFVFFILRCALWLLGSGYIVVLIGELFYTLSKVCFDSIASAYIFTLLKKEHQSKQMSRLYGHFNFIMYLSTGLAALVGAYFYDKFGAVPVLLLELFFAFSALLGILQLPEVKKQDTPHLHRPVSFNFTKIIQINKRFCQKTSLMLMIIYSGVLVAFSNFFFWSFQPLLKLSGAAVVSFGIIMFINNAVRCLSSYYAQNICDFFGLLKLGKIIYGLEILSFALIIASGLWKNTPLVLFLIFYLCCCIGLQLAFTINHISRLHRMILSPIRATVSSFNMMAARLCTSCFMIGAKFLLDYFPVTTILSAYICLILFPAGAYLLYKLSQQKII